MIAQPQQLSEFTSYETSVDLPLGYQSALVYNLTVELAPRFGKKLNEVVSQRAASTKENIAHTNAQAIQLKTDSALQGRGRFNIYAGW